ncbi:hypothetical protein Sjap_015280 [Stephania japonica]|uniref:Uncharacterized protein n=1 Tax=Stephania japonica TaxID=461633 RepID=A0AAP0NR82_9MAGN
MNFFILPRLDDATPHFLFLECLDSCLLCSWYFLMLAPSDVFLTAIALLQSSNIDGLYYWEGKKREHVLVCDDVDILKSREGKINGDSLEFFIDHGLNESDVTCQPFPEDVSENIHDYRVLESTLDTIEHIKVNVAGTSDVVDDYVQKKKKKKSKVTQVHEREKIVEDVAALKDMLRPSNNSENVKRNQGKSTQEREPNNQPMAKQTKKSLATSEKWSEGFRLIYLFGGGETTEGAPNVAPSLKALNVAPIPRAPNVAPIPRAPNVASTRRAPNATPTMRAPNATPTMRVPNAAPTPRAHNATLDLTVPCATPTLRTPNITLISMAPNVAPTPRVPNATPTLRLPNTAPTPSGHNATLVMGKGSIFRDLSRWIIEAEMELTLAKGRGYLRNKRQENG